MIARETTCPVRKASWPLTVEPLDGGEDLAAQVVLHVEREPTAEEPPQERRREPDHGEPEERGDDRPQRGRGSHHRLVDRRPREQRAHGIEAHTERRRHQRGDRHPAMAHRGTDEAADPAGGGSVLHSSTLGRGADSSHPRSAVVIDSTTKCSHRSGLQPRPVSTP